MTARAEHARALGGLGSRLAQMLAMTDAVGLSVEPVKDRRPEGAPEKLHGDSGDRLKGIGERLRQEVQHRGKGIR